MDKVIVVCDSAYVKHTQRAPDTPQAAYGRGTHAEWLRIDIKLYEKGNARDWLVPLLMDVGVREDVPALLRAWKYEQVNTKTWHDADDESFQRFWQRLHNTCEYVLPPVGAPRMPVKPSELLLSTPLDR